MIDANDTPFPEAEAPPEPDDAVEADDGLDEALAFEAVAREMAVEHLEALREMRMMGLELARAVFRRGMARLEGGPEVGAEGEGESAGASAEPDPGLAFSRITRAVRLCMAMEARTLEGEQARRAALAAGADEAARDGRDDIEVVRARIKRLLDGAQERADRTEAVRLGVEGVIRAQVTDGGRACELVAETRERLIDIEDWDRWPQRPIEVLIARVAEDLGLDPEGPRWEAPNDAPPPRRPVNRGPELARAGVAGLKALYDAFDPSG